MPNADINIRITGQAGRITLTRPQALNAMTYQMCVEIEAALVAWAKDPNVALVIIDAEGDRAFCSGGDIAELYATGINGDFAYGQKFWADEYRLNHLMFTYLKPIVSFLQGFTMGGGVGIGCHGSHRIVGESSQIAMPECGIGLIPDVGGSLILAQAPGSLGEYLGTTGTRMGPADAIYAGFADGFVPQVHWPALTHQLETKGDVAAALAAYIDPPIGKLSAAQPDIDDLFASDTLTGVHRQLNASPTAFGADTLKKLALTCPLSTACTIAMLGMLRDGPQTMPRALDLEYRFTFRAAQHGDFLEGIRAAIIDKDRKPKWQFADMKVPAKAVARMLAPLGDNALELERTT